MANPNTTRRNAGFFSLSLLLILLLFVQSAAFMPHQSVKVGNSMLGKPVRRIVPAKNDAPTFSFDDDNKLSQASRSSTKRFAIGDLQGDNDSKPFNPAAAFLWLGLVSIVIANYDTLPSGPLDSEAVQKFIADPINPDLNEIFYLLFNFFAVMPIILPALTMPQHVKRGLPAAPFLIVASAAGYFSYGIYLAFRTSPPKSRQTLSLRQLDGITKNVWENKLVAWGTVITTLAIIVTSNVIPALFNDPAAVWQDYTALCQRDKLALVASFDITAMHIAIISLIPRDYDLRRPDRGDTDIIGSANNGDNNNNSTTGLTIAAICALFPYLGPSLYMALRPSLSSDE